MSASFSRGSSSLRWLRAQLDALVVWTRRQLHALALAIRDSVLWPCCVFVCQFTVQLFGLFQTTVLQPVYDALYARYKSVQGEEGNKMQSGGGPGAHLLPGSCVREDRRQHPREVALLWFAPLSLAAADDSDTELADLLPEEEDVDDAADEPGRALIPQDEELDEFAPDSPIDGQFSERKEAAVDEDHLVTGLAFPTIQASESSDEEFDLARSRQRRKKETRPRDDKRDDPPSGNSSGGEQRPRRPRPAAPEDRDDNFEVLQ